MGITVREQVIFQEDEIQKKFNGTMVATDGGCATIKSRLTILGRHVATRDTRAER
jgi:hypothetical protein